MSLTFPCAPLPPTPRSAAATPRSSVPSPDFDFFKGGLALGFDFFKGTFDFFKSIFVFFYNFFKGALATFFCFSSANHLCNN